MVTFLCSKHPPRKKQRFRKPADAVSEIAVSRYWEEEGLCLLGSFSLFLVQFLVILHIADYDAAKFAQAGTGGDENITYSSFASVHL